MIEIAELTSGDTLMLPPGVAGQFRPSDRFIVWTAGDTFYLKRIMPRSVTDADGRTASASGGVAAGDTPDRR